MKQIQLNCNAESFCFLSNGTIEKKHCITNLSWDHKIKRSKTPFQSSSWALRDSKKSTKSSHYPLARNKKMKISYEFCYQSIIFKNEFLRWTKIENEKWITERKKFKLISWRSTIFHETLLFALLLSKIMQKIPVNSNVILLKTSLVEIWLGFESWCDGKNCQFIVVQWWVHSTHTKISTKFSMDKETLLTSLTWKFEKACHFEAFRTLTVKIIIK